MGGLVAVFLKPFVLGTYSHVSKYDICTLCNGILVGLVSITGVANKCETYAAFIIGIVGALFYILGCWLLDKLHIDDVVEATPIHMGGGIWGLLAVAFFDTQSGVFYNNAGSGRYLGYQILGIVVIFAWVTLISFPYFWVMKFYGKLRLSKSIEIVGLDIAEMGGVSESHYKQLELQFGHHMKNSRFNPASQIQNSNMQMDSQYNQQIYDGVLNVSGS